MGNKHKQWSSANDGANETRSKPAPNLFPSVARGALRADGPPGRGPGGGGGGEGVDLGGGGPEAELPIGVPPRGVHRAPWKGGSGPEGGEMCDGPGHTPPDPQRGESMGWGEDVVSDPSGFNRWGTLIVGK